MKNKVIAMLLSMSMVAGLWTGCVSAEDGSDSAEAVTLEILSLKTEEGPTAAFQEMMDNYTAANPNVTFEIQSMSSDDLKTTLRARSASGDMPDIITWMKEVEPEFLVDLSGEEFLSNLNADTVAGANAIYEDADRQRLYRSVLQQRRAGGQRPGSSHYA